ncbi:MAG: hypothetical protein ACLQUY_20060 [Ktedonobacterales bacterium]
MFKSAVRRVRSLRPSLESLEGRALLSTVHLLVDTLSDDPSGPVAGQTTLRDAITAADAGNAADKYVIKFAVDGTIALQAPLPDLSGNISIKGPGEANLTVQGGGPISPINTSLWSVFETNGLVKISGLTITDGNSFYGGGILNGDYFDGGPGTLTVSNVVFSNNTAYQGGAIDNVSGSVKATDCAFNENTAVNGGGGGAISANGTVKLNKDVFIDNSTNGIGGAILIGLSGHLTVQDSSFVANSASNGGAIFNAGTMTVDTSVFSSNISVMGSDIYNNSYGTLTIGKKLLAELGTGIYNTGTIN